MSVIFENVKRHFGDVKAVDDVSITVKEGEFFSMLGPSGSGKTTCLRLMAGFEQPTSGTIYINGEDATWLPPFKRNVNTVFQDYALFPHMTIEDNVGYGLMVKGVRRKDRAIRVKDALKLVDLAHVANRRPNQLSGGQQQRVALARALVNQPKVLLLDEPLGALDLKLREQMQGELKALQKQLGITFVFVTHDQGEALSMSDRIAVFNQGRIEQVSTPETLYESPKTRFVADFMGTANIIDNTLLPDLIDGPQVFALRPEKIRLNSDQGDMTLQGQVSEIFYQGAVTKIEIRLPNHRTVLVQPPYAFDRSSLGGQPVSISWDRADMVRLEEPAT
ncbi:spermidine/putrescine ABC transporter ATPase [Marinobacter santoriniensis NKSG1]|uniref:Spermidine/putrescine ABC transporter ATPase n=1 Tax=Marinobacter santoriniensis NKSG1 TaxID=1288826 RepID=M7D1Q4_9GAMM|nr:ABC transporter ATP-binding protein [Marinobacter santoriniensis]EMP54683.1 spermidine/putrescine ABC transporter ATPase [Marinobacter santoriniensis NKSG1]